MSIQSKIQRKIANYQRKVYDLHIDHVGQQATLTRVFSEEDKYGDREFTITGTEVFTAYINYPNSEIPITSGTDNTDTTQNNVHLYSLLPIELFVKHTTELKVNDIVYQKVRVNPNLEVTDPNAFRLLALQVVDQVSKFTGSDLVWIKYIVAPPTINYTSDELEELETVIDSALAEEWEDTTTDEEIEEGGE